MGGGGPEGGVKDGGRVKLLLQLQLLLLEVQQPALLQPLPPPPPPLLLPPSAPPPSFSSASSSPSSSSSTFSPSIQTSVSSCRQSWRRWRGAAVGEEEEGCGGAEVDEGEDCGGLLTEVWLLMSRKLASGGRRRTPERVDPSMAFWSWTEKEVEKGKRNKARAGVTRDKRREYENKRS